jgi:hypothetical protein
MCLTSTRNDQIKGMLAELESLRRVADQPHPAPGTLIGPVPGPPIAPLPGPPLPPGTAAFPAIISDNQKLREDNSRLKGALTALQQEIETT